MAITRPVTVAVTHTDRTRTPDGRFRTFTALVDVLAADAGDAHLLAAQIVAALRCDLDGMVLSTTIV